MTKYIPLLMMLACSCGDNNAAQGPNLDYDCRQRSTDTCFRATNDAMLRELIKNEPKPKKLRSLRVSSITDVKLLEFFNELEELEDFEINRTPALVNFKWMPKVKKLGRIHILQNSNFVNFEGWENVTTIKFGADFGPAKIHQNPKLRSFKGLENLVSAMDGFEVDLCPEFETIEHLKSLEEVMGITISESDKIKVFKALPNLKYTFGIKGTYNSKLERIEKFPKLETITTIVSFENNPNFIDCTAENFASAVDGFNGIVRLISNKPNSRCVDVQNL